MGNATVDGVDHLTGLTSANFNKNGISDLSPLSLGCNPIDEQHPP